VNSSEGFNASGLRVCAIQRKIALARMQDANVHEMTREAQLATVGARQVAIRNSRRFTASSLIVFDAAVDPRIFPLNDLAGSRSSDAIITRKNALLCHCWIKWRKSVEQVAVRYHLMRIPDVQRTLGDLPLKRENIRRVEHVAT
jgi:hypothetical protein